ncbi:3-hydroxyacyl-CoA dehydrogenase family protein [Patescibacteria group bacterium]|nr:3-hydroxyacyl-CoA dehydrogenase family protein [Patescibacteria group bacterium]
MKSIKTVTILGANGTMGSHCAGIIAGFGEAKIFMVARTLEKAQEGIHIAQDSIKTDTIAHQFIPQTYADLASCIPQSDWIFELTAENLELKKEITSLIAKYKKSGSIVSTVSSGLSINELSKCFTESESKFYFGTHFYNPPYRLLLCEFIPTNKSDPSTQAELISYLSNQLHRQVVITKDSPGFAGNRIGFQILNEAAQFANRYQDLGGITYIDELLGGVTGHTLPPMATSDLVGLDVHQAIVDNLYLHTSDEAHETFKMPAFLTFLISRGYLGNKSGQGLYKNENGQKYVFNTVKLRYEPIPVLNFPLLTKIKAKISVAQYQEAFNDILTGNTQESEIMAYFIARYISYSLSLVGTVVNQLHDIDLVMGYGFNWLPPSALIDLLGGYQPTVKLIHRFKLPVPQTLSSSIDHFYKLQNQLDYRNFIRAI